MKRIGKTLITATLAAAMMTGCGFGSSSGSITNMTPRETNGDEAENSYTGDYGFDLAMMEYMEQNGYADKNYMVSPTSLRAALTMATAGADGETKEQLLQAMGFESREEANNWYYSVAQIVTDFDENSEKNDIFNISNSLWHKIDNGVKLDPDYVKYVKDTYGAFASDVTEKEITDRVNEWVKENTNGLIPKMSNDLTEENVVLVNTIYLKDAWLDEFKKSYTSEDTFTTASGAQVQKQFMHKDDMYRYYEDENGKLMIMSLEGGIDAVFVLGDIENLHEAMEKAEYIGVEVALPKFEIESSFESGMCINFLKDRGAIDAFDEHSANFSVMNPDNMLYVSNVIQKTKITVEEGGIEAAAATEVDLRTKSIDGCMTEKEFIANEPFKFYICGGQNNSEILFAGQLCE